MQAKIQEREKAHIMNRELVTKNCGLQSHVDRLTKEVQKLKDKLDSAEKPVKTLQSQQIRP